MTHIDRTRIAILVDELPSTEELAHLDECKLCAALLATFRDTAATLRTLPRSKLPESIWARVQADRAARRFPRRAVSLPPLIREAAAVLLFVAGAAAGAGTYAFADRDRKVAPIGAGAADREARLAAAEEVYKAALASFTASAPPSSKATDTRLAVLEGVVRTADAALRDTPADPVIMSYRRLAEHSRTLLWNKVVAESPDRWF